MVGTQCTQFSNVMKEKYCMRAAGSDTRSCQVDQPWLMPTHMSQYQRDKWSVILGDSSGVQILVIRFNWFVPNIIEREML